MELRNRSVLVFKKPLGKRGKCPQDIFASLGFALLPMSSFSFAFQSDQPKPPPSLYLLFVIQNKQT